MAEHVLRMSSSAADPDPDRDLGETSSESFDRAAFARRALDLVRPRNTTVAICVGARRLRLESGRVWGARPPGSSPDHEQRWAMLLVSPDASRRAIALAVAELARAPRAYAFDLLLSTLTAAT
jgi:hypothetical protein